MRRALRWSMLGLVVVMVASGCIPKAGTIPISSPPEPAGCITDVGPADKMVVSGCGGDITYNVSVPDRCLEFACGLIVDVHGWTMTGDIQEGVTGLAALGRERGYIVIQPNAPGQIPSWSASHYPFVADFTELAMSVWRVDERRVHITGFSQGGAMTFWMRCNRPDLFASTAPTSMSGTACTNGAPNIPTLYIQGNNDIFVSAAAINATINSFVTTYGLNPGIVVDTGPAHVQSGYINPTPGGVGFTALIHNYSTFGINGHCVFGPPDPASFYGCDDAVPVSQGEIIMRFFEGNPRPEPPPPAFVIDEPGPVDIEVTSATVQVGALPLTLPTCAAGTCPALPAEVDDNGNLAFGLESLELGAIPIPVELLPGVPVTIELVPTLLAPSGRVIPANGAMQLGLGVALKLRYSLLPASCAVGPVQASVSAGPGGDPAGVPYDQETGEATLTGGLSEQLAVTGCGLFTGVLNSVLGLPLPIEEGSATIGVRIDPAPTGTLIPT